MGSSVFSEKIKKIRIIVFGAVPTLKKRNLSCVPRKVVSAPFVVPSADRPPAPFVGLRTLGLLFFAWP